jgi:hypothetical protein
LTKKLGKNFRTKLAAKAKEPRKPVKIVKTPKDGSVKKSSKTTSKEITPAMTPDEGTLEGTYTKDTLSSIY